MQFQRFRGVKDKGSEIRQDGGKEEKMIYSCRGMVCGVDWIHLIWVGFCIKKARGHWIWTKCMFDTILAIQRVKDKGSEIGGDEGKEVV